MMQLPFADADNEIEHDAGMKIPEYFERYGEPEFRKLESDVVLDMLEDFDGIFSLGGGAPMTPSIQQGLAEYIADGGKVVYLMADPKEAMERANRGGGRPSDAQRRRQRALEEVVQGTRPGVQTRGQCAGAHPRTNPASGREKADGNDRSTYRPRHRIHHRTIRCVHRRRCDEPACAGAGGQACQSGIDSHPGGATAFRPRAHAVAPVRL